MYVLLGKVRPSRDTWISNRAYQPSECDIYVTCSSNGFSDHWVTQAKGILIDTRTLARRMYYLVYMSNAQTYKLVETVCKNTPKLETFKSTVWRGDQKDNNIYGRQIMWIWQKIHQRRFGNYFTCNYKTDKRVSEGFCVCRWMENGNNSTTAEKATCISELIASNDRPVSNLSFISKFVEKAVLLTFNSRCQEHNFMPDYQSACCANYSCETALTN